MRTLIVNILMLEVRGEGERGWEGEGEGGREGERGREGGRE